MRAIAKGTRMGPFSVEFDVINHKDQIAAELGVLEHAKVRRVRLAGVVDTGAARLVLPASAVTELGLASVGRIRVRFADGHTAEKEVIGDVGVELADRSSVFSAVVEHGRKDAPIRAIVLEELDLIVDCTTQRLLPRDPHGMLAEIE